MPTRVLLVDGVGNACVYTRDYDGSWIVLEDTGRVFVRTADFQEGVDPDGNPYRYEIYRLKHVKGKPTIRHINKHFVSKPNPQT